MEMNGKAFLFLLASTLLALRPAGAGSAPAPDGRPDIDGRPPRRIAIGGKAIATATAANTEIVVASGAPETTRFAAAELQVFLSRILGGKIPVVDTASPGRVSIVLGVNQWSRQAGIDPACLVRDAFILKTAGGRVYIAGRDDPKANPERELRGGVWGNLYERGTLFGVYDFLERVGSVRMYFPGELGTVVPEKASLAIPELDVYDRPDFIQRSVSSFWDGRYFEGGSRDATLNPGKVLNMYRLRLQTESIPCCHGTNGFKYIHRFGRSHPEYFALLSNGQRANDPAAAFAGQLCWSSGIAEELYRDAKAYLVGVGASVRGIPGWNGQGFAWGCNCSGRRYVDIMPQDSFQQCRCARCQAAYAKGDPHYASELIWGVTVSIADRLKAEGIAGYVTQMAYRPYRRIPALDIPDNVLVMVAETGPWSMGNPAQRRQDDREIVDWTRKLGRKVWLWTYPNKVGTLEMPGVPQVAPRAYGEYYQGLAPHLFGAFAESESDRFLYNYLNYYIFAKVAWDNQADCGRLLDEHYAAMFGPAAAPMRKYYERLEDVWIGRIAGRTVDTSLGPVGAPPSDHDIWNVIYTPEALTEMEQWLEDADGLAVRDSLESRRIALVRREFQEPLRAAAEKYRRRTNAVLGWRFPIAGKPGRGLLLRPFKPRPGLEVVKTEVQAWRTPAALGVRFICEEPDTGETIAVERQPDDPELWKDNSVEIFLNPSGDRKGYFQLMINSEGSLSDQKLVRDGGGKGDWSWNSGADVRVEKQGKAWTAEVLIPLANLPDCREEFPANFARSRILKTGGSHQALYQWSPFARGFHDLENFGSLTTAANTDILVNGDFTAPAQRSTYHFGSWDGSRWLGGWIGVEGHTVTDQEVFLSPPYSVRLKGCEERVNLRQPLPAMKPGRKYRLSFYVKLEEVRPLKEGGGFVANVWDDRNLWFPAYNPLIGTMDWTRQSFVFIAGKDTNIDCRSYLGMVLAHASGNAWIDDVRLEELTR